MMTRALASLGPAAVACALASACAGRGRPVQPPTVPPPAADAVAAARAVVEQYEQGYEVLSAEALKPLYAPGDDVLVVAQGRAWRGVAAVDGYLRDLFARAEAVRLDLSDVRVQSLGADAAEVSAAVVREIRTGATTAIERGVLTLTLSRVGDRWLIRTEHFSYGR
ncbi:MAG: DUF4440 domain-containing protein [Deltaproteobacteria bacterium]|nr:MAG: DUF4440 domain-containing protein [Deltaproteobacteria bacterium]